MVAQVASYKSRVLFKGACGAIPEDALLLEVGPHGIMRSPLRQNCAGLPYVAAMKKGDDATLSVREAVAGLWRKGAALKWATPAGDVPGAETWSCTLIASAQAPQACCSCVHTLPSECGLLHAVRKSFCISSAGTMRWQGVRGNLHSRGTTCACRHAAGHVHATTCMAFKLLCRLAFVSSA